MIRRAILGSLAAICWVSSAMAADEVEAQLEAMQERMNQLKEEQTKTRKGIKAQQAR